MDAILIHSAGEWSWLQVKLVMEDTDVDTANMTSAFRLTEIWVRSTAGSVDQNLETNSMAVYVNGAEILRIGWGQGVCSGPITGSWKRLNLRNGIDLSTQTIKTSPIKHNADGTLTVSAGISGSFYEYVYTSPTSSYLKTYGYTASGSARASDITPPGPEPDPPDPGPTPGPTPTVVKMLTANGLTEIARVIPNAFDYASVRLGTEYRVFQIAGRNVTEDGRAEVTVAIRNDGSEIVYANSVRLHKRTGEVLAAKDENIPLLPGEDALYSMHFSVTENPGGGT